MPILRAKSKSYTLPVGFTLINSGEGAASTSAVSRGPGAFSRWGGAVRMVNMLSVSSLPRSHWPHRRSKCSGIVSHEGKQPGHWEEEGNFSGGKAEAAAFFYLHLVNWCTSVMWLKYLKPRPGLSPLNLYEGMWMNYVNQVGDLLLFVLCLPQFLPSNLLPSRPLRGDVTVTAQASW